MRRCARSIKTTKEGFQTGLPRSCGNLRTVSCTTACFSRPLSASRYTTTWSTGPPSSFLVSLRVASSSCRSCPRCSSWSTIVTSSWCMKRWTLFSSTLKKLIATPPSSCLKTQHSSRMHWSMPRTIMVTSHWSSKRPTCWSKYGICSQQSSAKPTDSTLALEAYLSRTLFTSCYNRALLKGTKFSASMSSLTALLC